jgi:hypothetical protein
MATGTSGTIYYDDFIIYKPAIAEPSVSFGAQQTNNLPPTLENVDWSFTPISVVDNAIVEFTILDVDGDAVNVSIEWYKNGANIYNDTLTNQANGTSTSFTLNAANYTVSDVISALLTPIDNVTNQGSTYNVSNQTIVGTPIVGISNLSVVSYGKEWVFINWSNPTTSYNTTEGNIDGGYVFNQSVNQYNFTGLSPNTAYNFSFHTWSTSGVRNNTAVWVVQTTLANTAPVIVSFTPSDTTPSVDENTTTTFNVTATDDDGTVWYRWLLDGVVQAFTQAWDFVTGYTSSGTYNVTVIVNDTYNATNSTSWTVTVLDIYPEPEDPYLNVHGEDFKYNIPVTCIAEYESLTNYYSLDYSVNGGSWTNALTNNTECYYTLDITSYDYGTNFSFRARTSNEAGESNYTTTNNYTKVNKNLFYMYDPNGAAPKYSFIPYELALIADFANNDSIYIAHTFMDCNGDGFYDYSFDYNETAPSTLPTKVKQEFTCVNYAGTVEHVVRYE